MKQIGTFYYEDGTDAGITAQLKFDGQTLPDNYIETLNSQFGGTSWDYVEFDQVYVHQLKHT